MESAALRLFSAGCALDHNARSHLYAILSYEAHDAYGGNFDVIAGTTLVAERALGGMFSMWRFISSRVPSHVAPLRMALALLLAGALGGALGGCAAQLPAVQATAPTSTQEATLTATVATVATCLPTQLSLTTKQAGAAAGHSGEMGIFTNISTTVCSLYGFPGAQMLDAQRNQMTTHALWQTSAYMYSNQPKQTVQLAPGGSAYFAVTWSDVPIGSDTSCPMSSYLAVTPPNDFSVLTVPNQITACGGNLEISPVEPTPMFGA